ncbi:MAG TPA: hypothetical protein VGN22_07610, partial [Pseudonocardia sp.]
MVAARTYTYKARTAGHGRREEEPQMETRSVRSWFVMPGDRADRFGEPIDHGAHAVICDLEDLVGPDRKNAAR